MFTSLANYLENELDALHHIHNLYLSIIRYEGHMEKLANETDGEVGCSEVMGTFCFNSEEEVTEAAPNDTAYKRWSCHSGHKLLCKLCGNLPPQQCLPDLV